LSSGYGIEKKSEFEYSYHIKYLFTFWNTGLNVRSESSHVNLLHQSKAYKFEVAELLFKVKTKRRLASSDMGNPAALSILYSKTIVQEFV